MGTPARKPYKVFHHYEDEPKENWVIMHEMRLIDYSDYHIQVEVTTKLPNGLTKTHHRYPYAILNGNMISLWFSEPTKGHAIAKFYKNYSDGKFYATILRQTRHG